MTVDVYVLLGGLLVLAGQASASQVGVETPCDELFSIPVPNGQVLADNSLLDTDGTIYPPDLYWDSSPNGTADWRGCICLLRPCVRKCCLENALIESESCVFSDHPSLYPFSPNVYNKDTERVNVSEDHFVVMYGDPCGDEGKYPLEPEEFPDDRYFLLEDGSLFLPNLDNNTLDSSQFCIELINNTGKIVPLMCFPVLASNEEDAVILMYPIGMLLSEPFLLVTVLVYALIPELRNLHGKSLMCHVSSLLTAYLFLSAMQLNLSGIGNISCLVSGFIIYYAFLASFFWLNVMCFDIWWTFSGYRPLRGSVKEREFKKFVIYSCYAWGCSLLLLAVCLVIDFAPGVPEHILRPEFGTIKCWLATRKGQLVYFYGPIGVLVITNVLLFTLTAVKIIQLKKETAMLKGRESKRHDEDENNKQRFILYLKLFVVMGVNWSMELVSFAIGGPDYLWYITDICNTLQGVLIFLIFVWKDKIRRLLAKRFCSKLSRTAPSSRMRSTSSKSPSRSFSSTNLTLKTSISSDIRLTPLVKRSESNGK